MASLLQHFLMNFQSCFFAVNKKCWGLDPLLHPLPPDLEDDGADGQEGGDPGERDQKASIHRGPLQSPAPAHDASQRLTRECLGEEVGNVPFKKMIKFTSNY